MKNIEPIIFEMDENNINQKIEEYLPVKSKEKELFGEVFTPSTLIIEMLNTLPLNIWKDPTKTWLDPANGIGNFFMIIYQKLLKMLPNSYKGTMIKPDGTTIKISYSNLIQKKQHIIKNMLYMIELNPKNVEISISIFGKKANILKGNFLNLPDNWNNYKFDIIIGNPPYNGGTIKSKTRKNTVTQKYQSLVTPFIEKSINILNQNGYLLFITPNSWINDKNNILFTKQILKIKFYNISEAKNIFKSSGEIPLCYYLVKNTNNNKNTLIFDKFINEWCEFNIKKYNNYIPFEAIKLQEKLLNISKKYGSISKYITKTNVNSTTGKTYPLIKIQNKKIIILKSSKFDCKNFEKKLLFPNSTFTYPILDKEGILQNKNGDTYILKTNSKYLKQIQQFFYLPLVLYLCTITRIRQKFINPIIFDIIPDITKLLNFPDILTEENVYKYFNFTNKDIKYIENYKNSGEGRLTNEQIKEFLNFNILNNNLNTNTIKQKIQKLCNKTNKNKSNNKSNNKTKKSNNL